MTIRYEDLYLRNKGYISDETQEKIRKTRVLIAGCGIGSTIAEAAMRAGFEHMVLADGDRVDTHNLNRQAFRVSDIGEFMVKALAKGLKEINPNARIVEFNEWINQSNVADLVGQCDLIYDTIDFLDIATITVVHDEANAQKKPIISAVSTGWGASAIYFPPGRSEVCGFRTLFGLPEKGTVANESYVEHFGVFLQRIAEHLDPGVVQAMAKALTIMEDGTPCPAPHVSAGSYAVASFAVTMAVRILNNEKVTQSPYLVLANMGRICSTEGIDLRP